MPKRFRFVNVLSPALIGEDGRAYFLDTNGNVVHRQPPSAFAGLPTVKWIRPHEQVTTAPWGCKAALLREQVAAALRAVAAHAGVQVFDASQSGENPDPTELDAHRRTRRKEAAKGRSNAISSQIIEYHASQIIASVRLYRDWHVSWGKTPLPSGRKPLMVSYQRNNHGTTQQFRALEKAVRSRNRTRPEVHWRQLTPAARFVLQRALDELPAPTVKALRPIRVSPGDIISSPIPSHELIKRVLPEAIALASRRRGVSHDAEEVLLEVCRAAFLAVTNSKRDLMTGAYHPAPKGPGADFIREVEKILGIGLLSRSSTHMIKRVRWTATIPRWRR